MIDIGLSKMALIGVVALVVIGPEKLPKVARTVGTLLGKAQRYVNDVKAEVNRSMELDELRKMKDNVESAARDVEHSIQTSAKDFEKEWSDVTSSINDAASGSTASEYDWGSSGASTVMPAYSHPRKNWRLKRGAVPQWYKSRAGVRTKAQSGAARVARFRPQKPR
ncbi:Sec-independent protein translocase subunit TatB [Diaphorobacter ruginosibacter]|jgi:sec-independent protein translocase protein TatB|uniref:Sec-independent protein translocase protein TatB n=1 Tax=Diaphorobacter ruginosibacter TaxID=1715720 RepID=A0A7G9RRC9_9BURK|nr:Sec-independent protein translocase protein TatB [Diaphorobacter ruginosibacter]MDR2335208.1 Sec-independent protein translocase protein TatB [Burkholderiaceae bacterium]QNN58154.1 Sec-independent protein translocase subunit TatB [Diaphorobacter ruginosibacter]